MTPATDSLERGSVGGVSHCVASEKSSRLFDNRRSRSCRAGDHIPSVRHALVKRVGKRRTASNKDTNIKRNDDLSSTNVVAQQAIKGVRWMPWRRTAMKDVASCDKPR